MKNDRYVLTTKHDSEITVRELSTGRIVAFSAMKADFESALEEFTWDFFTSKDAL